MVNREKRALLTIEGDGHAFGGRRRKRVIAGKREFLALRSRRRGRGCHVDGKRIVVELPRARERAAVFRRAGDLAVLEKGQCVVAAAAYGNIFVVFDEIDFPGAVRTLTVGGDTGGPPRARQTLLHRVIMVVAPTAAPGEQKQRNHTRSQQSC